MPDFKKTKQSNNEFYDIEFDRVLIEQSVAKQYGILPSMQDDLKYSDWSKLVGGLMNDTPLGQVVAIRNEKDRNILKEMTSEQKRIRSEWQSFNSSKAVAIPQEEIKKANNSLEKMLASMFGGGK